MEEKKRGRGRPRLDVPNSRCSRRQAVNSMYTDKASQLISEAATEIPDGKLLWYSDTTTWTIKCKNGIQISSAKCEIKQISNNTIKVCKSKPILVSLSKTTPKIKGNKV